MTIRPGGFVAWVASSRGDSIVALQLDIATGALTPTPGTAGCLRRIASQECRAARALDDPRGLATSADGSRLYVASALSDGVAVLGPQLAPNCLPVRVKTPANTPRSVVLACSDPNGDPVTLTIGRKPRHGRVGGLAKATSTILYTPAPGYAGSDSFTYTATDGLDVSAIGTAAINVTLPPKAPLVRIRTGRTPLLRGGHIHVLVECPAITVGQCRVAVHLLVKGRSAGYGFAKLRPRSTGRVVTRAIGVKGRTKAQVRRHRARQVAPRDDRAQEHPDRALSVETFSETSQASAATYSVTGGHVTTRCRSPYAPSMRRTGDQYFMRRRLGAG